MATVYPQDFEEKTGFDKIRKHIKDKCLSRLGEEFVDTVRFTSDGKNIREALNQTAEFVRILQEEPSFPADYFIDVRYSLNRIRPEGTYLDERDIFDLKRSLQTIYDIIRFFKPSDGNDEIKYPVLAALANGIPVFPKMIAEIDGILDKYGQIKDNASPELQRIRREKASTMGGISRSLQSILRSAQSEGLVDKDVTPTMRDGRLMIPVAPAFKRKIRGIVHDESASGKTIFIEPEAVVEANNRIRELESEEKREILLILIKFTDMIRPSIPDILQSYSFLAEIDFIRAKALFALDIGGIRPDMQERPHIDWYKAVHPLLFLSLQKQGKETVPLDITLDGERRILIISGPNAGGKSVCLKTVGLLQYMLQCGLLIPLHEQSQTGIFEKIFIDIGDEQSIENDLSTYSSHLTNMKHFVKNCNDKTLLLIDEFGSGTEPTIGGALAEALLERFNRNKSFGIVTTHYQNLKQYAEEHEGTVNGAMLYDRHLMQPLFKLSVGRPGSSFAIEIARKIGLPEDVIAEASEKVGSDYIDMDKYLQDIIRDKRYWEIKRQNIRRDEKRLEELIARYESDLDLIDKERKEIVRKAKAEAQNMLSEANAKIENTIREIKESQAGKKRTRTARQALRDFKEAIDDDAKADDPVAKKMEQIKARQERKKAGEKKRKNIPSENANPTTQREPEIGDAVRIKGQQAIGTLIELNEKQAIIAFGMIKSSVKLEQIELSDTPPKKENRKSSFISEQTSEAMHETKLHFKPEIDVRGMRGDEALQAVTYFIDDAIQTSCARVRILHGTGSGILRQLIRDYLKTVPGVAHVQDEHVQLGGAGITVVDLR